MKPKKNILELSFIRIKREPTIWILLVICIYAVFAYYFDSLKIYSHFQDITIKMINEIALGLSYSYIAGMIFYYFSVFRPNTKKARAVLVNAVEDLRFFKDDFSELSRQLFGDDWLTANDSDILVFREIAKSDYDSYSDQKPVAISNEYSSIFKNFIRKFDFYLNSTMAYEQYLSSDEYERLTEIRLSFSFSQIRIYFNETDIPYYKKKTLLEFIRELIVINRKVVQIYHDLSKYGYDFHK